MHHRFIGDLGKGDEANSKFSIHSLSPLVPRDGDDADPVSFICANSPYDRRLPRRVNRSKEHLGLGVTFGHKKGTVYVAINVS